MNSQRSILLFEQAIKTEATKKTYLFQLDKLKYYYIILKLSVKAKVIIPAIGGAVLTSILIVSILSILPTNIQTEDTLLPGKNVDAVELSGSTITYLLSYKMNCFPTGEGNFGGWVDFELQILAVTNPNNELDILVRWLGHDAAGNHLANRNITLLDDLDAGKFFNDNPQFNDPLILRWSLESHADGTVSPSDVGLVKLIFRTDSNPNLQKIVVDVYPSCSQLN